MAIGPPTGMRDWLPQETLLRQRLMETIGSVYQLYGYLPIDTPAMEDLEVLLGKGGGENEKLLFKILKRGDKLAQAEQEGKDLADYGLRFDLTVPLARFVATHQGKLPKIFRRYHIGPVWRADRPQLGRYREFYQCDIDVVGGASTAYEIEIITATERVLARLNLGKYRFRLSDKRLLPLLLRGFGVAETNIGPITITLDKLDKGDITQVRRELDAVLAPDSEPWKKVTALLVWAHALRAHDTDSDERVTHFKEYWDSIGDPALRAEIENVLAGLQTIRKSVLAVNPQSSIVFDPILVRGMDYYTGPIYEAVVENFSSSILGGGRYDGLIGTFAGKDIPAVGCSIGFERVLSLLQDRESPGAAKAQRVLLVRQAGDLVEMTRHAEQLRAAGLAVESYMEEDDLGKQLKYAEAAGMIWAVKEVHPDDLSLLVRHLPTRQDQAISLADFQALLHSN
jgi:histidyl-tRNA synthetase